jgi:hypothetical protein
MRLLAVLPQVVSACGTTQCNSTLGGDCAYGTNCPYYTYKVRLADLYLVLYMPSTSIPLQQRRG